MKTCPVCGSEQLSDFMSLDDWFLSHENYNIVRCDDCGFRFTNPRPDLSEIGKYYKSEEYISHSNTSKSLFSKAYQMVRNYTIAQKYKDIVAVKPKGRILDIGCATAEFLSYFKGKGWDVNGVEPDAEARAMAIANHQIDVQDEKALDSFPDGEFDVITMWHVLEHVYTLNERVAQLKRLLKKDGLLVIAVPNPESADAKHYKEYWAAYDVPRHIYHFAQRDIKSLFAKYDFDLKEVKPMKFDAYYVSMLSEKYLKGKSSMCSAIRQGCRSNRKARKTGEYSSLIYYLRLK